MPWDKFVRWQIAGDELTPNEPAAVAATGFLAAGPVTNGGVPTATDEVKQAARYDELDDIVYPIGTRSVANHLNDNAKTDPAVVIKTLKHWRQLQLQRPEEL